MSRRGILTACALAAAAAMSGSAARSAGPEVRSLLPSGGQRGTAVAATFNGNFPTWPVQAWSDAPGMSFAPAEKKGEVTITITADAAPGTRWLRLYDAAGVSEPVAFVVGTLAEVVEKEPNNSARQAQAVPAAASIANGRLAAGGDSDHFSVPLAAGQTLVASLAAHETLGSPLDAVLHVVSPTGHQLAYNHDQRGLDPEIVYTAPAEGSYVVRVFGFPSTPNSTIGFTGNDRCVYRLTLTAGAFVDYPWPLAATRGRETAVELVGWNIPDSLRSIKIMPEGEQATISDPRLANVATLLVEPHETLLESEPNEASGPQALPLPATISGRIERSGDVDLYRFEAKKGEALSFALESRALGYPLDGVLEITDEAGKSLAKVDDVASGRDPLVAFSPPADGAYRVLVSDLNRQGSARHVYRLRATRPVAAYEVAADAHAYTVSPEKPAEITLAIDRQNGFGEEIGFAVSGLPEFVSAAAATSGATGEGAKTVKLALTSTGGEFSGPIRINATATGASKLARTATAATGVPPARIADLWLTATGAKK
jgi:hypothetical protein